MAGEYLRGMRKAYSEEQVLNGNTERGTELAMADDFYTPMLKVVEIHGEVEPNLSDVNSMMKDTVNDLDVLHKEMAISAFGYSNLLEDAVNRIKEVKNKVNIEQERLMDLNMLCGTGSGFDTIRTLTIKDFVDPVNLEDGIYSAHVIDVKKVECKVTNVMGNGFEGNKYVYQDNAFLNKSVDTASRQNMVDDSIATSYEYARINASSKEEIVFADLSFDEAEAECSVTLEFSLPVNNIKVETGISTVVLKEVLVSEDGLSYTTASKKELAINERDSNYTDSEYIYGSGIITFPMSSYVKIVLRSKGYTKDKIAFEYIKNLG